MKPPNSISVERISVGNRFAAVTTGYRILFDYSDPGLRRFGPEEEADAVISANVWCEIFSLEPVTGVF